MGTCWILLGLLSICSLCFTTWWDCGHSLYSHFFNQISYVVKSMFICTFNCVYFCLFRTSPVLTLNDAVVSLFFPRYKCYLKHSWSVPRTPVIKREVGAVSGFSHKLQITQCCGTGMHKCKHNILQEVFYNMFPYYITCVLQFARESFS